MSGGEAPSQVRGDLAALQAGALEWLGRNLAFFSPFSPDSGLPPQGRVKAALELAIFCRCWARLAPPSTLLGEVTALLRTVWQLPEFASLIDAQGNYAQPYGKTNF